MKAQEIKKGIYWVGGIDWDLRNFHGYTTHRGSTYNAYLIIDEKVTLIDTVKYYLADEMIARIKSVIDPSKIDYIVSNHVEMDHSGALPDILKHCPNAKVFTSPNGEKGLKMHYDCLKDLEVVNTGDSISLGKRTLQFVLTQMVHWPDSMVTYIPEEKLLLPNDAFGQHIASSERFDDEIGWDIAKEEAEKYYANIVLPYGNQVQKALEAVGSLDIDMVAPSHGIIWREHIKDIIGLYSKWANNETEEKALVIYDTMWHSTEKMAEAIFEACDEQGINASKVDLKVSDMSDVMTHVLTAKYIFIGSPTLNNGMLPTVAGFLTYLKGLAPKGRKGLAFGSYGWGGQSIKEIHDILESAGFDMMDPIRVQYVPSKEFLREVKEKIKGGIS